MKLRNVVLASSIVIFLFTACERNKTGIEPGLDPEAPDNIVYTQQDSAEAAQMALWMTGELVAPPEWVSKLMYDLYYLRYKFSDEYIAVNVRFMAPWKTGNLACKVDSLTAYQINHDQYPHWDQLPVDLRPDPILNYPDILGWTLIGFSEIYHPERMKEYYEQLPGFVTCEPNYLVFIAEGGFNLFPRLEQNGTISWLFCLNMSPVCYYFKTIDNKPRFIGEWNSLNEPKPDWWNEARLNRENFY